MAILLEKFVRPAQQRNIRPPRQSTTGASRGDAVITLKIDLGGAGSGNGGPKLLTGAFSSSTSTYIEAYVVERRTVEE